MKKLSEELEEAFPHLSPNEIKGELYEHRINEIAADVNARDGYRLIGYFDAFCKEMGIDYFAIANTLVAAVVYQDFIPGKFSIEVGMLRSDYLKFEKAYQSLIGQMGSDDYGDVNWNPSGFRLLSLLDDGKNRRRIPLVTLCSPEIVMQDGLTIYGPDHLPLRGQAKIEISIMDGIPDDYDLQRVLFYRAKLINKKIPDLDGAALAAATKELWRITDGYNDKPHKAVMRLLASRSKGIDLEDAFPTRQMKFGPVEIAAPRKTNTWVNENAESQAIQVKYLQEDAMAICKEIDRICRKHKIGYFICGGTMLGLVRHGGFIPWDDDMDVGMLRADYDRFMEVAADELAPEYFLQTRESDPNIPYLFSKVRLKNSEYITKYNELRDFNKGICVDVFPFDRVPLEYGTFDEHYKKARALSKAHNHTANGQIPMEAIESKDASNPFEAFGKSVMTLRHKGFWNKSLAETQKAYVDFVTKYNDDERLHYVASFVPTFTCVRLDDLLPYQDVDFEGETLMAPAHPEVFLQMQYGDFMSEPMLHQQRGHGLLRWKGAKHNSDEFEL